VIFLSNKYSNWYYQIIRRSQSRKRDSLLPYEKHHIIPKSLGGSNDKENLTHLTPREHFLAHRLLAKMTTGRDNIKMVWAIHRMMYAGNRIVNSHTYEVCRRQFVEMLRNDTRYEDPAWRKQVSELISQSWQDNEQRRSAASSQMKEKWTRGVLKVRRGKENPMWGKTPWNKGKKLPNTGLSGERNPQAKIYVILTPTGETHESSCLKTYCSLHGLDYGCMKKVSQGKNKQHRGYTIVSKQGKECR